MIELQTRPEPISLGNFLAAAFACTLLFLGKAQAQEVNSTYSFTGPCASQGSWTAAALTQTNQLKQIISKLKDNPACHAMKANIESGLTQIESSVSEIQQIDNLSDKQTRTLMKLPKEMSDLRSFSRESTAFKKDTFNLMMEKTITSSVLTNRAMFDSKRSGTYMGTLGQLGQRTQAAAHTGLRMFNSTILAIQQAEEACLDSTQGISLAAGLVKVLSSFASSNTNGLGTEMAKAVQNLGQYLYRDKKYVDALRKLNDREFTSSMSCLLEITTDGYCQVLDAQHLFREIMQSQSVDLKEYTNQRTGKVEQKVVGLNQNFSQKLEKGPLAGYYILSKQLPVISNWIQKVQFGIDPQLPTEASFQNGVMNNTMRHMMKIKTIQGDLSLKRGILAETKGHANKQSFVLEILNDLVGLINDTEGRFEMNFFARVSTPNELYFQLLGMQVPDEVNGKAKDGNAMFNGEPRRWLNAYFRGLPQFADPDKLVQSIEAQLNKIFEQSSMMAVSYYNKYFIVDKTQVINDSILGMDVNVRDAFVNIDRYLENLQVRIEQESPDKTIAASIIDTRTRIANILNEYQKLRQYSIDLLKELKEATAESKQEKVKNVEADLKTKASDFLVKVYSELEILTARTSFLANRLTGFVYQDFTLSLRKRDFFEPYFEDMMLATGYSALNSMMNLAETEYSKIKTDLDQAMNIHKKNIDSLEEIAKEGFVRNIFDLKLSSLNREISEYERWKMAYNYAYKMEYSKTPGENSNKLQRTIRGLLNSVTLGTDEKLGTSVWDNFTVPFKQLGNWILGKKAQIVISPVSEFGTAAGEMAKICTQTLAFPNLRVYWELCKNSQLDSPMLKQNVSNPELAKLMNTYLSVNYVHKAYENIEPNKKEITGLDRARNYQARICALRDYHRRNEVARVTSGMLEQGENYESPFIKYVLEQNKISETPPAVTLPPTPPAAPETSAPTQQPR